jgi:hypothetical protein
MRIIGCDLHAAQQTIALLDRDTGEIVERTLNHEGTAVRDFYAGLRPPIVVGIEATGSVGWFLELMADLGIRRARSSRSVFARLYRRLTSMLFAL